MQFSTCEVSCVVGIQVMTSNIEHIIALLYDNILAKFYHSRLKCLFVTENISDPKLAVKPGYESAISRHTLPEFQRREISI